MLGCKNIVYMLSPQHVPTFCQIMLIHGNPMKETDDQMPKRNGWQIPANDWWVLDFVWAIQRDLRKQFPDSFLFHQESHLSLLSARQILRSFLWSFPKPVLGGYQCVNKPVYLLGSPSAKQLRGTYLERAGLYFSYQKWMQRQRMDRGRIEDYRCMLECPIFFGAFVFSFTCICYPGKLYIDLYCISCVLRQSPCLLVFGLLALSIYLWTKYLQFWFIWPLPILTEWIIATGPYQGIIYGCPYFEQEAAANNLSGRLR